MPFNYDQAFTPPFPRLPVVVTQLEDSARAPALLGLVDTGADITLIPTKQLQAIGAVEIYRARLRSHWGEGRTVGVYLVDLQVAGYNLPGIEVIADDTTEDALLGRNVLNRLVLLLDGPAGQADVLPKRPTRL